MGSPSDATFKVSDGKIYICLYLIMVLGIPFAMYRSLAFDYVFVYAVNVLLFFFCLRVINTFEKLEAMMFTVCCSALFYGAFSLIMSDSGSERFSYGSEYDPNDLAYILVALLPVSIYYVTHNRGFIKRVFGIATVGISLITILLTGSRGGFLGLISIALLLFITNVSGIKWTQKIALVIICLALFATFGNAINMERYKTLQDVGTDYNVTAEDGRLALWRMGIKVALSNPLTGVGANCIGQAIGEMKAANGEGSAKWQTAHNSYIEMAAEIGLIGFILYITMIIGTVKKLLFCQKAQITSPNAKEFQSIAASLQLGFIGSLVAAFFLSQAYSVIFALYFALSAVMKNIARIQFDPNVRR